MLGDAAWIPESTTGSRGSMGPTPRSNSGQRSSNPPLLELATAQRGARALVDEEAEEEAQAAPRNDPKLGGRGGCPGLEGRAAEKDRLQGLLLSFKELEAELEDAPWKPTRLVSLLEDGLMDTFWSTLEQLQERVDVVEQQARSSKCKEVRDRARGSTDKGGRAAHTSSRKSPEK